MNSLRTHEPVVSKERIDWLTALALLLALTAAGLSFSALGPAWWAGATAIASAALLTAGWVTRRAAVARQQEVLAAREQAIAVAAASAAQLQAEAEQASDRLGSVWSDLIEVARNETEGSITELTERFGHIVVSLEQSIRVANEALHGDAIAQVERNGRAELAELISELRESCRRELVMRDRVEALAGRIEQLREGADSVQAVAKSTTLLSLNAAIEASRAGNSGSGFSVVAVEMQRLSQASGELGVRMAETSTETIDSISEAVDAVRESVKASEAAAAAAEARVARVLDEYSRLTQRISASGVALTDEARSVNESVAAAIVSLQFQDRTSQILCHVRDSVRRAPQTVFAASGVTTHIDATEELDALSRSYATQQERDVHAGRSSTASSAGDITFF